LGRSGSRSERTPRGVSNVREAWSLGPSRPAWASERIVRKPVPNCLQGCGCCALRGRATERGRGGWRLLPRGWGTSPAFRRGGFTKVSGIVAAIALRPSLRRPKERRDRVAQAGRTTTDHRQDCGKANAAWRARSRRPTRGSRKSSSNTRQSKSRCGYAIEVRPARKLSTPCRLGALCLQRFTALALRVLSAHSMRPKNSPARPLAAC
jgi:hypothetical protein